MNLQDLFNLAARKGKASTIFVPQQEQPSYLKTAATQPQRASTIFIPQKQMPSYLETAAQQPQRVSTVFIPEKQMPSYLDTAAGMPVVSPLFKFPKAQPKESSKPKSVPEKPEAVVPAAVIAPAGTVQPGSIVSGLTPAGTIDYSQGDEYKAQMAQYRNLIAKEKEQEAEDLGMKIWQEKYGKTPMAQPGGAVGAYNPLLAKMFPETKGFAGTFAPVEEVQMGDLGTRAQGEFGPTMETLGMLNKQEAQQQATADQADMATTVKLPIRNRVQAFLQGGM